MILKDLKRYIQAQLLSVYNTNECESIAYLIIEYVFSIDRTKIIFHYRDNINDNDLRKVNNILSRLKNNEPIQYIIGITEFYDLQLKLNTHTLIPRQETELLVDNIIRFNKNQSSLKILDIGTGSGCIAISLAKNIKKSNVYAVDISNNAIKIAEENAKKNNVRINFSVLDIINYKDKFDVNLDIIVSNPPYVTEKEKTLMHKNVLNFEPNTALFVSNDRPLIFYEAIISFAEKNLKKGGQIWFEINEAFGKEIEILLKNKNYSSIKILSDFNDKERFVLGIKQ